MNSSMTVTNTSYSAIASTLDYMSHSFLLFVTLMIMLLYKQQDITIFPATQIFKYPPDQDGTGIKDHLTSYFVYDFDSI